MNNEQENLLQFIRGSGTVGLAFVFLPRSLPCLPCEALLFRAKRGATPKGHKACPERSRRDTKHN